LPIFQFIFVSICGMLNSKQISSLMHSVGFDAWGVVRAEKLSDAKVRFEAWLEDGAAYRLDYLSRNIDKRFDPTLLVPEAKSVIVGAVSYKNRFSEGYKANFDARIASYALTNDYHTTLREMLRKVALGLGFSDPRSVKICVDSVPLAEKSLAKRAGIGWIGRNSLIINPSFGSFMVLCELIVPEECDEYSTPYEEDGCVGCGRCLLRCPTGAIRPNRSINTALCISNRTIEQGENNFDSKGWIFGCDECQSCCPHNAKAPLATNPRLAPTFNPLDYNADFWATLPPEEAQKRFGHTALARKFQK
jgi:epoxyqueuosine reductase